MDFPRYRPRRLRRNEKLRELIRETTLNIKNFIYPLFVCPGKRFLLPRAATARDILPRTLKKWGAEVDVVQAYRTVPAKGSAAILNGVLSDNKVDMVTFTSSSTVKYFVDLLSPVDLKKFCNVAAVACIGPITKGTAESNRIRVDVLAKEYTVPGLIEAIVEYFTNGPGKVH